MYDEIPVDIPIGRRLEINKKILSLIRSGDTKGITNEEIYNVWSQLGGLHGLKREDYRNYAEYSEAKKKKELGQFFTPDSLCKEIVGILQIGVDETVADMSCGKGSFFNALPCQHNAYGCEIEKDTARIAQHLFPDANIEAIGMEYWDPGVTFDVIIGNPPYNMEIAGLESQFYYVIRGAELLNPGGLMAVVMPGSFLNDDFMNGKRIGLVNDSLDFLGQYRVDPRVFGVGVDIKVMFFRKHIPELSKYNYRIEYDHIADVTKMVARARAEVEKASVKKALHGHSLNDYSISNSSLRKYDGFEFLMKKYLFDIKRDPIFSKRYKSCIAYIAKFKNQKMPDFKSEDARKEYMKKHWITKPKVLAYLRQAMKPKKKERKIQQESNKSYRRRMRELDRQMIPNDKVVPEKNHVDFLDSVMYRNKYTGEEIRLNAIQKKDTAVALSKDAIYLQWTQGSGKTLAGLSVILGRMNEGKIDSGLVVGPAIAIRNTWADVLEAYDLPFVLVKNLKDVQRIGEKGLIFLMTVNTMGKYAKRIKKRLKVVGKRIQFVLDEADLASNMSSKRTKNVLSCFGGLRYKLLLSGRMTRNNIVESYPQFRLMYGSSGAFLSLSPTIFEMIKYGEDKGRYVQVSNHYWDCPYPPYKAGMTHFANEFNPEKITVLGIGKHNQDIRNPEILKDLIGYSIITRSFEEIAGKTIYHVEQVNCEMSVEERELYLKIMQEFSCMERAYFGSTGNARKDSMLKMLHQLNLLLRACSVPHLFLHGTVNIPNKFESVFNLLEKNPGFVAIGCTRVETVKAYRSEIAERFRDRKLYVITGAEASIDKRRAIVKEIQENPGSILLSTQQSLSCSMNIGFVDTVIIPELDWNDAKMSQYYFRFIRYNSLNDKTVYFVTYKGSIETNLLGLVMTKEKLTRFMRSDFSDTGDILDDFGLSMDIFEMMLQKVKDENGVRVEWGQQKIG